MQASPGIASRITRNSFVQDHPNQHKDSVGRPGLDPGTLGLKLEAPCPRGFDASIIPGGVGESVGRYRLRMPPSMQFSSNSVANRRDFGSMGFLIPKRLRPHAEDLTEASLIVVRLTNEHPIWASSRLQPLAR